MKISRKLQIFIWVAQQESCSKMMVIKVLLYSIWFFFPNTNRKLLYKVWIWNKA